MKNREQVLRETKDALDAEAEFAWILEGMTDAEFEEMRRLMREMPDCRLVLMACNRSGSVLASDVAEVQRAFHEVYYLAGTMPNGRRTHARIGAVRPMRERSRRVLLERAAAKSVKRPPETPEPTQNEDALKEIRKEWTQRIGISMTQIKLSQF